MENSVQNQNSNPVMPPPPVQESNNQTPAGQSPLGGDQPSQNSSRNTLLLVGSILIFVAIVGITLYFLVQNQQEQAGIMTDDATNTENQQVIEPNQAQSENFVPDKSVICARFTNVENALNFIDQACVLDLSGQDLDHTPPEIISLTNLKELNLSNNNISIFPEELFTLKNLTILDLSNNSISSIPESVSNSSLQVLKLRGNPITINDIQKYEKPYQETIEL
jgi:Leucine-rich repeat (LRR) protein